VSATPRPTAAARIGIDIDECAVETASRDPDVAWPVITGGF